MAKRRPRSVPQGGGTGAQTVQGARSTAKSAGSGQGIVLIAMIVAGGILYKRSKNYTTKQNVGHATGLLLATVALVFVADIGGGTIAAGLAILIVFMVAYKEKKPASGYSQTSTATQLH